VAYVADEQVAVLLALKILNILFFHKSNFLFGKDIKVFTMVNIIPKKIQMMNIKI
jgi:hypothetical protein